MYHCIIYVHKYLTSYSLGLLLLLLINSHELFITAFLQKEILSIITLSLFFLSLPKIIFPFNNVVGKKLCHWIILAVLYN